MLVICAAIWNLTVGLLGIVLLFTLTLLTNGGALTLWVTRLLLLIGKGAAWLLSIFAYVKSVALLILASSPLVSLWMLGRFLYRWV
jgi:hypothetical protein